MRRLVSSASALAADRTAETLFGYPSGLLMEEAGIRLQDRLESMQSSGEVPAGPVAHLVGPGNNGGDALVMARQGHLRGRTALSVVQVVPPAAPNTVWQTELVRRLGIPFSVWPEPAAVEALGAAAVWIDGLWGIGLKGPLRPLWAQVVSDLDARRRSCGAFCWAIDVPSGLWDGFSPGDAVLPARWTLAPGWLKDFCFRPEAREVSGRLLEVPLAFPQPAAPSAELIEEADLTALLPAVQPSDHKGTRGHVALVGGAPGMSGALVLAARSAAASGAGLVSLGVDPDLIPLVAPQVPAFQTRVATEIPSLASRYDALVVGPGWGRTADRCGLLETLWKTGLPLVVDADGLAAWAALDLAPRSSPVILTPHPGEFRRLGAGEAGVDMAARLAEARGVTVVLKGAVTWIFGPDGRRAVWDGANAALGTGGSGDCLAGVAGALLARGLGGFDAARSAVALHGTAGKALASREGWFTADRLPDALALAAAACMAPPRPL